jgi:hypothetical protein
MAFEDLGTWKVWAEHDGRRVFEHSFELAARLTEAAGGWA